MSLSLETATRIIVEIYTTWLDGAALLWATIMWGRTRRWLWKALDTLCLNNSVVGHRSLCTALTGFLRLPPLPLPGKMTGLDEFNCDWIPVNV